MDKAERAMYKPLPVDTVRVCEGEILPTDLCLSVMKGEWLRADDPRWLHPATVAEDAFMVARPVTELSLIQRMYGGHLTPIEMIYGV